MKIRPIGDRVVVKIILEKKEERTASGLILYSAKSEESCFGEIISKGQGKKLLELNEGDKIVFSESKGVEIKEGPNKYLILDLQDILAVIE